MAIHKKEEFTQKEQDLANFAKAIHGLLDHAVEVDRRFVLLLSKLEEAGVHVEGPLVTSDQFDPQYLSKIVD